MADGDGRLAADADQSGLMLAKRIEVAPGERIERRPGLSARRHVLALVLVLHDFDLAGLSYLDVGPVFLADHQAMNPDGLAFEVSARIVNAHLGESRPPGISQGPYLPHLMQGYYHAARDTTRWRRIQIVI